MLKGAILPEVVESIAKTLADLFRPFLDTHDAFLVEERGDSRQKFVEVSTVAFREFDEIDFCKRKPQLSRHPGSYRIPSITVHRVIEHSVS